jgi:16S rRNA G966 N2-methylase RsmD
MRLKKENSKEQIFGQFFTPISLVNKMLDKVDKSIWSNKCITFLEPSAGDGNIIIEIIRRRITGGVSLEDISRTTYAVELQEELFDRLNDRVYKEFGIKINTFNNDFFVFANEINMKFDVIIGNPPYGKGLHLKFLELSSNLADKVVFVEPAAWVQSHKSNKKYRDLFAPHLVNVELVNGQLYFPNAEIGADLGIFVLDMNNEKPCIDIDSLRYASHTNPGLSKHIHTKLKFDISIANVICIKRTTKKFVCNISNLRGHVDKSSKSKNWNFYTIFTTNDLKPSEIEHKKTGSKIPHWVEFDTMLEAKNFIDYCNTDFAMFMLRYEKNNMNITSGELKAIPYMEDYTKPWTDERLAEYFKLTNEEVEYIKEEMKPFGYKARIIN